MQKCRGGAGTFYVGEQEGGRRLWKGGNLEQQNGRPMQMKGSKMCISNSFVGIINIISAVHLLILAQNLGETSGSEAFC